MSERKIVEWFLRVALSAGFLSAVADRFGLWPKAVSVWGTWENFLAYTKLINPWVPDALIPFVGGLATLLEVVLAGLLLTHFKTALVAKCSGALLLLFALAMASSVGIKAPFDYSVFAASAAAFALSVIAQQNNK